MTDFDAAAAAIVVFEEEVEKGVVEVDNGGDFDRRRAIASRDEAPLGPLLLLLLLLSNEPIGDTMPECVPLLKRALRGSIEGREKREVIFFFDVDENSLPFS